MCVCVYLSLSLNIYIAFSLSLSYIYIYISVDLFFSLSLSLYIYIYLYMCVCVCVILTLTLLILIMDHIQYYSYKIFNCILLLLLQQQQTNCFHGNYITIFIYFLILRIRWSQEKLNLLNEYIFFQHFHFSLLINFILLYIKSHRQHGVPFSSWRNNERSMKKGDLLFKNKK